MFLGGLYIIAYCYEFSDPFKQDFYIRALSYKFYDPFKQDFYNIA